MIDPIRLAKGFYMAAMFAVFFCAIIVAAFFCFPFLWIVEKLSGPSTTRMQWINRNFFSFWLALLRLGGLLRIQQAKGFPINGPAVIVANHPGLFDVLVLVREVNGLSMIVKRSLASKVGLWPVFRMSGYIPAPGKTGTLESAEQISALVRRIKAGDRVLIFPEGTRSPKGSLGAFQKGPFHIARTAKVPVQPVVIYNDPPFMPHEDKWYYPPRRISTLRLEFLEAIAPDSSMTTRQLNVIVEKKIREALGLHDPEHINDKEEQACKADIE